MPEPVQSDAAPRPQGQDEGRGADSDHGEDATKNGEHTSSSEGIDATPKDETADTAVLQDKPVTSKSTPATRVKRALLSRYILLAESQITSLPTRTTPVFSLVQDVEPPTLHSNRENRILFYPGCFNRPHAGHAALLWQTYLCTDASTIAVLIFALPDESLSRKQNTPNHTGKDFKLSHFQRRQLWKDDILSRFTWVFPSDDSGDAQIFMRTVQRLAWRDGCDASFPTLYGGDHISREDVPWGWNGGTWVISGVTRAVDFAPTLDYDDGDEPLRLKGCGRWKKMQQEEWEFREEHDSRFCWPCWPCQKLIAVLGDDDDDGEDDCKFYLRFTHSFVCGTDIENSICGLAQLRFYGRYRMHSRCWGRGVLDEARWQGRAYDLRTY
jgi:hypothetical protein